MSEKMLGFAKGFMYICLTVNVLAGVSEIVGIFFNLEQVASFDGAVWVRALGILVLMIFSILLWRGIKAKDKKNKIKLLEATGLTLFILGIIDALYNYMSTSYLVYNNGLLFSFAGIYFVFSFGVFFYCSKLKKGSIS